VLHRGELARDRPPQLWLVLRGRLSWRFCQRLRPRHRHLELCRVNRAIKRLNDEIA
jgi:hypothetical protein